MFSFLNQQTEILKLLKCKFGLPKTSEIFHFERILNQRTKSRKFAKYEGLFLSKIPVGIGSEGQKSLSGEKAILEKKTPKKGHFLVKYKEN